MIRELVALKLILDQESRESDKVSLHQRDYQIGLELKKQPVKFRSDLFYGKERKRRNKILQWLSHVVQEDVEVRDKSKSIDSGVKIVGVAIVFIGLLLGVSAAATVFYYDGTSPINILPAIFLFVVIPLFFLLYFIILAFRDSKLGARFSGGATDKSLLPSPFYGLQKKLIKKMAGGKRQILESEMGTMERLRKAYTPFVKWKLRYWTQLAAIFYLIGALGWLAIKITTTDLAFSWSTTLNISPNTMNTFTSVIAAPWSTWMPGATVDLATIEKTQYYRATQSVIPQGVDASEMGRWWGFLLMAMIFYGLLPRIFTMIICDLRVKRGFTYAVLALSKPHRLPDRLDRVLAPPGRNTTEGQGEDSAQKERFLSPVIPTSSIFLEWGNIEPGNAFYNHIINGNPDNEVRKFRIGHDTLEEDDRVLAEIGKILEEENNRPEIIVLTSAWEPPVADFTLFLEDLLKVTADETNIIVLPVAYDGDMLKTRYHQDVDQYKVVLNRYGEHRLIVEETNQTMINQ
ncbi:MAG: DUF2868 domain-containing protein [Balneolales bacterium]